MEYSIRMVAVVVIVLIILAVCLVLVMNWGSQSNSAVSGLFKFFEGVMGGKQITTPSMPNLPA